LIQYQKRQEANKLEKKTEEEINIIKDIKEKLASRRKLKNIKRKSKKVKGQDKYQTPEEFKDKLRKSLFPERFH